jgi:hypothetical protein
MVLTNRQTRLFFKGDATKRRKENEEKKKRKEEQKDLKGKTIDI